MRLDALSRDGGLLPHGCLLARRGHRRGWRTRRGGPRTPSQAFRLDGSRGRERVLDRIVVFARRLLLSVQAGIELVDPWAVRVRVPTEGDAHHPQEAVHS